MTIDTADRAVIWFIWDYSEGGLREPRLYIIQDGGVRTSKPVGVSTGSSIEFFLVKTMDWFEVVQEATAGV